MEVLFEHFLKRNKRAASARFLVEGPQPLIFPKVFREAEAKIQ